MNLLFIFTDQMHRFALRCMGTADIETPHLDRLASEGVLFRNAYSNCPICTPFRLNLFTGLYNAQLGTYNNEASIPPGVPTLPQVLENAGVRTSFVGKWHIGGKGNGPIPSSLRGGFRDFIGYQCYNGFYQNVCFYDEEGRTHRFDVHREEAATALAIERLRKLARQPFALFIGYQAPHYPVQPPPEFAIRYAGRTLRRRPNCQEIDPYTRTWSPPSPWPPNACPDYQRYGHNLDEYLRLYYGMVSHLDHCVGRLLNELEQLGIDGDTVVVFTSDHGDMQGSHGLKNKCLPHEESSGIPLIVRCPTGPQNVVSDALVSGVDFFPTILDWFGLPPLAHLPGRSFAPITRGLCLPPNGLVFSEMKRWKMIRHGPYKLVTEDPDNTPTMLFNLDTDPYELHNHVHNPGYAALQSELRAAILRWQVQCARTAVAPPQ